MPIYEYACNACEHELEALQKMSDAPLQICPACGEEALRKLVSAAGFRLKGSGWYETDFKGKSKKVDSSEKSEKTENVSTAKTETACGAASECCPCAH